MSVRPPVRPVFVFGISGATWTIAEPLMREGLLPNLEALCAAGARGTLLSVPFGDDRFPRPQIAWATIATGVGPSRHGVTRFFHEGRDLQYPTAWDRFHRAGYRVGLVGWPGTWPPPPVAGFVIPSHLARDAQTRPDHLDWVKVLDRQEQAHEREPALASARRASVSLATSILADSRRPLRTLIGLGGAKLAAARSAGDEERALVLRAAKLELMGSVFARQYRRVRPAFAGFVTFHVDFASHRYWRYMNGETASPGASPALRDAVRDAYRRADAVLGRLQRELPADSLTVVLSEHGMEEEVDPSEVGAVRYVLQGHAIGSLAGLADAVVPCPIARWIAFRQAGGGRIPSSTREKLARLTVVETGLPFLHATANGSDEVVVRLNMPADGCGLGGLHVEANGRRVPMLSLVRALGSTRSAMHAEEAMIVIAGEGVARGQAIEGARLEDILPSILAAAGLPVDDELEGCVIGAAVGQSRSMPRRAPVQWS